MQKLWSIRFFLFPQKSFKKNNGSQPTNVSELPQFLLKMVSIVPVQIARLSRSVMESLHRSI